MCVGLVPRLHKLSTESIVPGDQEVGQVNRRCLQLGILDIFQQACAKRLKGGGDDGKSRLPLQGQEAAGPVADKEEMCIIVHLTAHGIKSSAESFFACLMRALSHEGYTKI